MRTVARRSSSQRFRSSPFNRHCHRLLDVQLQGVFQINFFRRDHLRLHWLRRSGRAPSRRIGCGCSGALRFTWAPEGFVRRVIGPCFRALNNVHCLKDILSDLIFNIFESMGGGAFSAYLSTDPIIKTMQQVNNYLRNDIVAKSRLNVINIPA